jgi:hypothetical protein
LPVGPNKALTCKATTTRTPLEFSSTVLGVPFNLKATGVSCLPHKTTETSAKIEETEEAGVKHAIALGKLKSVVEPAGCVVPKELTTEPLRATLWEEREGSATGKTPTSPAVCRSAQRSSEHFIGRHWVRPLRVLLSDRSSNPGSPG